MWGFQSLKDSVQTHAAGLFRNISDRIGGECGQADPSPEEGNNVSKDAMKNVVTPKSIPQFTLPPLLTYDSPPCSPTDPVWQEPGPHTMHVWSPTKDDRNQISRPRRNIQSENNNRSYGHGMSQKLDGGGSMFDNVSCSGSESLSAFSINSLAPRAPLKKSNDEKNIPTCEQVTKSQQNMSSPRTGRSSLSTKLKRESFVRKQRSEQPGLGLQHLLSNKAGFSTLSESPTTTRKESLFLSNDAVYMCAAPDSRKQSIAFTRSCSPNYRNCSSRRRTKDGRSHKKSLERGYRSAEISCNSDQENSSSDTSIASYPDAPNGPPLMRRIRSRRITVGRNYSSECNSHNNSSAYSTPQGSPSPSPATFMHSHSKSGRKVLENDEGRLGHLDGDSNLTLSPSNSEGHLFQPKNEKRRLCASAHNVHSVDDNTNDGTSKPQPSIRVCLTYLPQHKRLNISILEGKNFLRGHTVYLKVTLLPRHDRGHRTDPIKLQSSTPNIRERLTFECVREEDIPHMSLKICCKEKSSRIRHAEVVGECILALCDINFHKANDVWANFRPFEEEEAPHIQLSLCYDAMLGCLTVDVVAARNLPKGSLGRQPDSFVTLAEVLPNAKVARKQTKVAHRTQNPVFQESFLFSLCTDAQTPDELVIVATLFAKDRVRGTVESMGSVELGQLVYSWSGRSQWAQALANEGEPVTYWHTLQVPHI